MLRWFPEINSYDEAMISTFEWTRLKARINKKHNYLTIIPFMYYMQWYSAFEIK